jgi:hypothetical protein
MPTTTDPEDPRLSTHESDGQQSAYLVLSEDERAKGFVRPLRTSYTHNACGTKTVMADSIAATYARDPNFYTGTWCTGCQKHLPLAEFKWVDGSVVGS